MKVTAESYLEAAMAHVEATRTLLENHQFPLSNYLAGLAVECLLRAYSHRLDDTFDARHDLRH